MSFSIVEGDVTTSSIFRKADVTVSTSTSGFSHSDFLSAFILTSISCFSDLPVDFLVDIFTEASFSKESHIFSMQVSAAESGGEASLSGLRIPGTSIGSRLYVRFSQTSGINRTFRAIIFGEKAQNI